jgi:hypothetical protein
MLELSEFQSKAASLPVEDRAALASFLIHTLPVSHYEVTDEEVSERARQLESGEVKGLGFDELKQLVEADRKR